MTTDIQKLEFIEIELNRLTNYFNSGKDEIKLPKEYFEQMYKALEILHNTAFELFDNISQDKSNSKEVNFTARMIMNRLFK